MDQETRPQIPARRARTPLQLERQAECFRLSVMERKTTRQIAAIMGIDQGTVIDDIAAEGILRSKERDKFRESDLAVQLAMLDDLYVRCMAGVDKPGTGALQSAAKAIEMRAKLLGLDAPAKLDLSPVTRVFFEVTSDKPDPQPAD